MAISIQSVSCCRPMIPAVHKAAVRGRISAFLYTPHAACSMLGGGGGATRGSKYPLVVLPGGGGGATEAAMVRMPDAILEVQGLSRKLMVRIAIKRACKWCIP